MVSAIKLYDLLKATIGEKKVAEKKNNLASKKDIHNLRIASKEDLSNLRSGYYESFT